MKPFGGGADPGGHKTEGRLAGIAKRNPTTAIGIGGVALVVVIALVKRKSSTAAADAGTTAATGTTGGTGQGTFDSTATDVYNSLEGQLQILQNELANLNKKPAGNPGPHPKPKPKPKPKRKPKPKPKPKPRPRKR